MSEHEQETGNGEELIDDESHNPTQQKIDEETNDQPAQGEGGQDAV